MAFRSFAILSALATAALAQSSNPLIPSNISASCTAYLSALNNNTQIQSCLTPVTTALSAFDPTGNLSSCSISTVTTALSTLCSTSSTSGCSQSTITSQLSSFYSSCSVELTSSPNNQVKLTYDALYVLLPLRQAVCAKDDNGDYCVTQLSNSSAGNVALVDSKRSLSRRDTNSTTILIPNTTTFLDSNLAFFFLQPNTPTKYLCTACTRNILTPYITFESNALFAYGINNSLLLGGQFKLYNNITNVCGGNFFSGAVAAAGGLSQGIGNGALPRLGIQELSTAMGAILGVAGLVAVSM